MPFRSERQRKYLWSQKPSLARRWTDKYGSKVVPSGKKKRNWKPRAK
jgi:hypothetical protein